MGWSVPNSLRRFSLRRFSLRRAGARVRITAVACAAFFVAVLLGAVLFVWAVRDSVEKSLDETVRARATSLAAQANDSTGELLRPSLDDPAAHSVPAQIVDEQTGEVLAASPTLLDVPRISTAVPADDKVTVGRQPLDHPQWEDAHVAAVRTTFGGHRAIVYAAVDQDQAERSVESAQTVAGFGVPALLAIFGMVIWTVVGNTLRPVEDIRKRVADISASNLSQRVPVPTGRDAITRLALTMNAMLDRLELSAERQSRFVADVSHELHSPLASSRAELEVARAHPDSTDWSVVTEELLADNSRMELTFRTSGS